MNPRIIVIDGKTYKSVNEMPADVRRRYEQALGTLKDLDGNRTPDVLEDQNLSADRDRNGIPDMLENAGSSPVAASTFKVVVNGQEYNRLDDLPPDAREKYEQAMGALDANRNGIPDFMEGMIAGGQTAAPSPTPRQDDSPARVFQRPSSTSNLATPDTTNGWTIALAFMFLFFVCTATAAGLWQLFLR